MTKPTKKGTHKATKTKAKIKTIDRPSQISPDTKRLWLFSCHHSSFPGRGKLV